jgi:predicted RNA-binding Zn ribbon-like protein
MDAVSGQWLDTDGVRWWFDSGALSLDFAWTGAVGDEGRETLHSPSDLERWLSERFPRVDRSLSERELSDALMLRAAIAGLAVATTGGRPGAASDVDVINLFAATPDVPPVLAGGSRQAGAASARATQALSTIARDAVRVLGGEASGRLRACAAADCGYFYLDTSRSGNRRWCSMQRCGNRAKVRAHRERSAMARVTR